MEENEFSLSLRETCQLPDPITRKCRRLLPFPARIDEFIRTLSNIHNGAFLRKNLTNTIFIKKLHHRFYEVLNTPLLICILFQFPIGSLYFFRNGEVFLKVLKRQNNENQILDGCGLFLLCLNTKQTFDFLICCLFICFSTYSVCTIIFL